MQVRLLMVSSLNGKTTRFAEKDIYHWTSREDSDLFFDEIRKARLIVMGSKTYESAKEKIRLTSSTLRIVLTQNPEHYQSEQVPGSLEFTSESPTELVNRMKALGIPELLLVGGGTLNASFLKERLVNTISLTIEPYIFGSGAPLCSDTDFSSTLVLESIEKLNEHGTVHLRYRVVT